MKVFRITSVVVIAAALHAAAPKPKLVREIKVNALIHESEGLMPSTHSVQALAFSPDNKWIAVAIGRHYKPGTTDPREFASHVIVVPTEGTTQPLQIDPGVLVTQNALIWAPDSSAFVISTDDGPKWYAIPGGELRKQGEPDPRLGMVLGFVDTYLGAAYAGQGESYRAERDHAPRVLYIFDLTGRIVDEWRAPSLWWFAAVNPDRHFLAVSKDIRQPAPIYPIFGYPSKTVVQGWSQDQPFGSPHFAEAGKVVCGGFGSYGRAVPYATCWDVDTGRKIAEFKGFRGGDPASVSSHASRIILTHIRNYRGITEEFDMHSYHDRVVWDFRTDKVIAEWVPITQVTETGLRPPEDKRTEFGPSVISPSGRYIAEGSNGVIRIYELF
jgi:hypothetical protein